MRKITYAALSLILTLCLTSCEGCVKKMSKKATEIGLGAAEGVTEALKERGEKIGEKTTDAASSIIKGVGKSLDKHLNVSKTTVYFWYDEDFDRDELVGDYDIIATELGKTSKVQVGFIGKNKEKQTVDVFMRLPDAKKYNTTLVFFSEDGQALMNKRFEVQGREKKSREEYLVVQILFDEEELTKLENTSHVKVTIEKE